MYNLKKGLRINTRNYHNISFALTWEEEPLRTLKLEGIV